MNKLLRVVYIVREQALHGTFAIDHLSFDIELKLIV